MGKINIRKTSLSLVALLLITVSILPAFAGCAQNSTQTATTSEALVSTSEPDNTEPVETSDPNFTCDLKNEDYGGEKISIYATGHNGTTDEFYTTEIEGNIVNDAVFKRNAQVEKDLNVKFNITLSNSTSESYVPEQISVLVKAGETAYDICTMGGWIQTPYVVEGDFYNLKELDNVNLEKHYWAQGYNEGMGLPTQQYTATGMFSISLIRNLYVTIYNKDLFHSHNLPDLYELTVNGEWTIEKQLELIKDTYKDVNGNQKKDEEDFYGFVSGTLTSVDPYWTSFGIRFLNQDKEGLYHLTIDADKLINAVDLVQQLIVKSSDSLDIIAVGESDVSYNKTRITMFAEEKCLMACVRLGEIEETLTASEFSGDYGIVPFPKYDKEQENYHGYVQDQLSVISIVSNVSDNRIDMVSHVYEKICAESCDKVFPAYYDTAMSYRYMNNIESKKMLDLIYNSIEMDSIYMYVSMFYWQNKMRDIVASGNSGAGSIKKFESVYEIVCDVLNSKLENLRD